MRIFTITDRDADTEKKIQVGFSEKYSASLPRDIANYKISFEAETDNKNIGDLRVLIIGSKESKAYKDLNSRRFRVDESNVFEMKEKFFKPNENTPVPLIFIYKKVKVGSPIAATLAEVLKSYYFKLIPIYATYKKNYIAAEKINKSEVIKLNKSYEAKIKGLANKLFLEIASKDFALEVKGVMLDHFFIHNSKEGIFLEETIKIADSHADKKTQLCHRISK